MMFNITHDMGLCICWINIVLKGCKLMNAVCRSELKRAALEILESQPILDSNLWNELVKTIKYFVMAF